MRASPLALLLLAGVCRAADVFVIADSDNQTHSIADAAQLSIAEANDAVLANDTLSDPDFDNGPVVRKKRTFGDIVFRGLADVLGYNVARKPPQIVFPPPLAPVPGIDGPFQALPVAVLPVVTAAAAPAAPAPPPPPPCGKAAAPLPCRAQAPPPPPPPPKPAPPPCPKPRANPRPKPRPKPQPPPKPAPPPPCGSPRANPTTAAPCAPPPPPPPPPSKPKADSNLETFSSNFRLDFNFNRAPAAQAALSASEVVEEQAAEQEQDQAVPVIIQPQAAKLPPEPPRNPRVYLDAFVVRNGVAKKIQTFDAQHLNQHQADNDYLVYDEEPIQQDQDDDYEDVQESRDRAKAVQEFGNAVDRFWGQKQKPKKKLPANDYRNVHFGDRDLANQLSSRNDEKHQSLQKERVTKQNRIPLVIPDDEEESTTTTQDPRRPLKPRVLPPTEHNPNQIDTVTVRVPPIYKEKRPKKLHRERPERPDRDEEAEDDHHDTSHHEYSYRESPHHAYEEHNDHSDTENSETENSESVYQTEPPKRKRRRKNRRKIRSTFEEHYTAGDFDYYGKKIPISKEEEFFRGLTIPPPTKDADLERLEQAQDGNGHFLDDHERLRDDPERIKSRRKNRNKGRQKEDKERKENADEERERADESERTDVIERTDERERSKVDAERADEKERVHENERTDKLSPNARVRETGYQTNFVRAHNVQVDDPQPRVTTVKKRKTKTIKKA